MKLSIIAAMSKNRVIGRDNALPWHLPEDLKRFKKLTLNNTVLMGRKTYESIGHPLANRDNIVLSKRNTKIDGAKVVTSIDRAFEVVDPDKEIFIIGGESIYRQTMELVDRIYLTIVDSIAEGDSYFPEFSVDDFEKLDQGSVNHDPPFSYHLYQKGT